MDKTHFRQPGTMVCSTQHGKGKRWRAYWVDDNGKPNALACDTKTEAQQHLDGITTPLNTGTYADPRRSAVTFGVVAEAWIATKAKREPKTVGGYRGLLDVVIPPREAYRCGTLRMNIYKRG